MNILYTFCTDLTTENSYYISSDNKVRLSRDGQLRFFDANDLEMHSEMLEYLEKIRLKKLLEES